MMKKQKHEERKIVDLLTFPPFTFPKGKSSWEMCGGSCVSPRTGQDSGKRNIYFNIKHPHPSQIHTKHVFLELELKKPFIP